MAPKPQIKFVQSIPTTFLVLKNFLNILITNLSFLSLNNGNKTDLLHIKKYSGDLSTTTAYRGGKEMNNYNLLTKHWSPYKKCVLIGQLFLILLWMIR